MASSSLEFTLSMNTGGLAQGMARAREELASNLRGMSQAARNEGARIQAALNTINLSENVVRRINETRTALSAASTDATRLGNAFRQSQAELTRLIGQIDRARAELTRLRQTPAARRTSDQSAAIAATQQSIQNLRSQADDLREITATLGRDYNRTNRSVARLNNTLSAETGELSRLQTALQSAGIDTNRLSDAQATLQTRMAQMTAQARELQRIQGAREILNLGPRVNTELEIYRVRAAYEQLRVSGTMTTTELARGHLAMTERIIALQNSTSGWGERIALVREQLVKLAVAGAGLGMAANAAIKFESSMSDVRKVVDFQTPEAFKELTADIKNISREIPITLDGLAKITQAGGQMGIAAKDLNEFTKMVSQMATAFKIAPEEVGMAVGRMKNIFALTIPQTRLLADAINHLGNNTVAVERNIVEVMNRTGGMARVFGLANTETAALAATFLSMGLGSERSATAINALMRELMNAPQQTEKFKNALIRIGLSAEEMADKIRSNPQQAIMDLLDMIATLDKQTKMETLVGLFGDLYSDEIVQVVNNMDKYREILGLVSKEITYAGSMQKEFAERIKTTESQLQLAKNAIAEVAVNLGSAFLPAIVAVARGIAAIAHGLADLVAQFPNLSAAVTTTITALAGFGALRLIWSALRVGIISMIAPLTSLTIASLAFIATPLGATLTAIGAAAWAVNKAMESSVPALLENANALSKTRKETEEKIKVLQALQKTLETTQAGTQEHTDAEEKLAQILPGANVLLDEQGRVLARVGDAASANAVKLKEYLDLLQQQDQQNLALQLDAQARAFAATKSEMGSYVEGLKSYYGIGEKSQSIFQNFTMWMDKSLGLYDANIAKGAELRRQLGDTEAGMKSLLAEAHKAGLSVDNLGKAMDSIHADPETKKQVLDLYRSITHEAEAAVAKVGTLGDTIKQFTIAMTGPTTAAKNIIVEAIKVTNKQLGKYNEAISKHRAELKNAVDDETASWKAIGEASERASKTSLMNIEESYAKRQHALEQSAQAEIISQRTREQAFTALIIEESNSRLIETERASVEAIGIVQQEFDAKEQAAKRFGRESASVDEERLMSQRAVMEKTEAAYRQSIDKLIAEEQRHNDAAKQLAEQRMGFNESTADRLARLAEKGLTEAQVHASRETRIAEEQAQAEKAFEEGRYADARKHADRMIDLAESTAKAVKQGDTVLLNLNDAVARSTEQIQKASKITNEAFKNEINIHKESASSLQSAYNAALVPLGKLQQETIKLDEFLQKNHQLILDTNVDKVQESFKTLDELIIKKNRVIDIKVNLQDGVKAIGTVIDDVIKGETNRAQQTVENVSRVFENFKNEMQGWQPEITAQFKTAEAESAINNFVKRYEELKKTVPIAPEKVTIEVIGKTGEAETNLQNVQAKASAIPEKVTTAVSANIHDAISKIRDVQSKLDALKDKTVYVNVVKRNVEGKSHGGLAGFAMGGQLPGFGGGDRIPALLEAGEFVVRKERASLFAGLLHLLNFGTNAKIQQMLATMPKFQMGGLVRNRVNAPVMTLANGGPVVNLQAFGYTNLSGDNSVERIKQELIVYRIAEAEKLRIAAYFSHAKLQIDRHLLAQTIKSQQKELDTGIRLDNAASNANIALEKQTSVEKTSIKQSDANTEIAIEQQKSATIVQTKQQESAETIALETQEANVKSALTQQEQVSHEQNATQKLRMEIDLEQQKAAATIAIEEAIAQSEIARENAKTVAEVNRENLKTTADLNRKTAALDAEIRMADTSSYKKIKREETELQASLKLREQESNAAIEREYNKAQAFLERETEKVAADIENEATKSNATMEREDRENEAQLAREAIAAEEETRRTDESSKAAIARKNTETDAEIVRLDKGSQASIERDRTETKEKLAIERDRAKQRGEIAEQETKQNAVVAEQQNKILENQDIIFANSMKMRIKMLATLSQAIIKIPNRNIIITANVSQALFAIALVAKAVAALKSKTITVTVRTVNARAMGGWAGMQAMSRGGRLPGFGGGDRVHAILEAGEFVVRKDRASIFAGLLHLINSGPLSLIQKAMTDLPRFQNGGLVNNLYIPQVPNMAFAAGGSVPNGPVERFDIRWNGRPVAQTQDAPSQLRGLLDELKDGLRGVLS